MLTTIRKDKIPRTLSYSVGAELLSEILGDVPQASELRISFGLFRPICRKDGRKKPYPVLSAVHSGPVMPPHLRWTLRVSSVPNDAKHDVKELLAAEGFVRVKQWLEAKAKLKQIRRRLTVMYDETQKHLTYEEEVG